MDRPCVQSWFVDDVQKIDTFRDTYISFQPSATLQIRAILIKSVLIR